MSEEERFQEIGRLHCDLKKARSEAAIGRRKLMSHIEELGALSRTLVEFSADPVRHCEGALSRDHLLKSLNNCTPAAWIAEIEDLVKRLIEIRELEKLAEDC